MPTLVSDRGAIASPDQTEIPMAKISSQQLAKLLPKTRDRSVKISVAAEPDTPIEIPGSVFRMLVDILTEMSKGNAVTIVPYHAELTTQEAANLLNVSRPFLIKQLEAGAIPFHLVGKHRRIKFIDLMDYECDVDKRRGEALRELTKLDQELGLGYQK